MKTNSEIRRSAREALSGNWTNAVVAMLIYGLIIVAASAVTEGIGAILIEGAMLLGLATYFLNLIRGKDISFNQLFRGFRSFGKTLGLYLLVTIYIFLWTLLLVIPGIVACYKYSQVFYILADNPEIGISDAIAQSKQMMNGNKMNLFLLQLSFIGWTVLSLLTGGIGFIWLSPYYNVAQVAFYESIKPRSEIITEIVE